jgi:D-amino-acid dehydrogenase
MIRTDILVLGAGMAGLGAALHVQARGRSVALVDRRGPAEETSFGNAGIVQREGVVPYTFPQDLGTILKYALNRSIDARYHLSALPRIAPALFRYWRAGTPERIAATARANLPIIRRCLVEHEALMQAAGVPEAMRKVGYLKTFRDPRKFEAELRTEEEASRTWGVAMRAVDGRGIAELEPHLIGEFAGAIHMTEPGHVADPGGLGNAYARLFERRGGRFLSGDARSLEETREGWTVATEAGPVAARETVVALGPWSGALLKGLGYAFPLFAKRGYHMHYAAKGNAVLNRPVIDADVGAALMPMARGLRLTTFAEFSTVDAPPTPVQFARTEPRMRTLFPIGERLDPAPWLGRRPCLPDMLPIVGRAPRHPSLWLHFGHHHLGFTLGPTTGRLLAEMMTGETPFTDPAPYRAERF